jgi:hypothetical protein
VIPPLQPSVLTPKDHATLALEAWKKVVQTQEHFNEICMKVRTLYATVLAAVLSLYGVFLKDASKYAVKIAGFDFDPILAVCMAVFVASTLFYFVDKQWYHRLLLGAVDQGIEIEDRWGGVLPEIKLGSKIAARSPVDLSKSPKTAYLLKFFVDDERFRDTNKLHSDAKLEVFYKPIRAFSVLVFVIVCTFGGISYDGKSLVEWVLQVAPFTIT